MMRGLPSPWEALLIAAAGWRIWHLLAVDAILDGVRDRIFYTLKGGEAFTPRQRYTRFLTFLECPYCAGFWVTAAVWAAWVATPWALVAVAPFSVHTGMLAIERLLDRGE